MTSLQITKIIIISILIYIIINNVLNQVVNANAKKQHKCYSWHKRNACTLQRNTSLADSFKFSKGSFYYDIIA